MANNPRCDILPFAIAMQDAFFCILLAEPCSAMMIVENTPLRRIDGPDELAPTIVFLLSQLSAYVDGQTFIVDGGWTAR